MSVRDSLARTRAQLSFAERRDRGVQLDLQDMFAGSVMLAAVRMRDAGDPSLWETFRAVALETGAPEPEAAARYFAMYGAMPL